MSVAGEVSGSGGGDPDLRAAAQAARKPGLKQWWWLALVSLAYAANNIDRNILSIIQEPVKHEFLLTDSQLGSLMGLTFGLVYGFSSIGAGMLADRVNRRNMLVVALSIWSVLTAACAAATGYASLLAARMAVAAAESGGTPASTSMLSDWFPAGRRATAMAIYYLGPPVGYVAGYLGASHIAEVYGWRAAFLAAGAPGVIIAVLLLLTCPNPKRGALDEPVDAGGSKGGFFAALAHIWRTPELRLAIGTITLCTMGSVSLTGWIVSFLMRQHEFSLGEAGRTVAMCLGLLSVAGVMAGGPLAERLGGGPRPLRIGSALVALSCLGLGLLVFSPTAPLAIAGLAIYGLLHQGYIAPVYSTVLDGSPAYLRGGAIGVLVFTANLVGATAGPIMVGLISDVVKGPDALRWGMLTVIPEFLGAALLLYLASRVVARKSAKA